MADQGFASGDIITDDEPLSVNSVIKDEIVNIIQSDKENERNADDNSEKTVTPESIEQNENVLKDRIAHCKNLIESLKQELNEEKCKLKNDAEVTDVCKKAYENPTCEDLSLEKMYKTSSGSGSNVYDADNLLQYEKHLEKFQNTLDIAQQEKKKAMRRQMLSTAFKLKLLEIENTCNVELLRLKQCRQCLQPLKIMMQKWKTEEDKFIENSKDMTLPNTKQDHICEVDYNDFT